MIVQTVKFPNSPDDAVEGFGRIRPLLDKFFTETNNGTSEILSTELAVILWHSYMLDFVELLNDDGERVGILASNIVDNTTTGKRTATIAFGYVEPEYRGKGWFSKMLEHAVSVFRARRVDYIDVVVNADQECKVGKLHSKIYRLEV